MRVFVLSQNYDPEPIPKPGDLARELKRRGHDVTVVTGFPNYPEGRLYPGFALRALQREVRDGVDVLRGFVFPYHGPSPWRRIIHYASFVVSATFAAMRAGPFDAIYVWHPPLTVGIAAWLISRWHRAPFLYDMQDIRPESVAASGMSLPPPVLRAISVLECFVYAKAAHLLVVTEGARGNLIGTGVPEGKVSVFSHWVDPNAFQEPSTETRNKARQSLRWLEDQLQFLDRVPADRITPILAAADALLVSLKPSVLADLVIPSKTFSSLASGRPLVVAVGGAAACVAAVVDTRLSIHNASGEPRVVPAGRVSAACGPGGPRGAEGPSA